MGWQVQVVKVTPYEELRGSLDVGGFHAQAADLGGLLVVVEARRFFVFGVFYLWTFWASGFLFFL